LKKVYYTKRENKSQNKFKLTCLGLQNFLVDCHLAVCQLVDCCSPVCADEM